MGKYFEILISNVISRILGAIMRSFLIAIGLLIELFYFVFGALIFFGWLVLPAFLIIGLYYGFTILF